MSDPTMSKKRVQFDLDEEQIQAEDESKLPFNKKFKHTLDSDESDDEIEDEQKYKLNLDEFDGEEEGNLHRDGEITITPFNVKDELKEGHFDDQGMYIFNKETEDIRDNWIDNIDWEKIKKVDQTKSETKETKESNEEIDKVDLEDCLKNLIELMNPNETVQKAIQRLGKSKLKNQNKNKNKNRQQKNNSKDQVKNEDQLKEEQEDKERKDKLNKLIEISNQLFSDGDLNIYETTYEAIKYRLDEKQKDQSKDELDMFAN